MNYIVFDCETANTMDDPFVYDLGWSVIDDNFNVLVERSFVNADIFIEEKDLTAQKLIETVDALAEDKEKLKSIRENAKKMAITDANEKIADIIMTLGAQSE